MVKNMTNESTAPGDPTELTEGLVEFVAIVDAGSVSAAARSLRLPRPTLSRRLSRLEERLGVRLLHRTTRRLSRTEAGQELYLRARPIVVAAREAHEAVRRLDGVPRGTLRVSAPPGAGITFVGDLVFAYLERYPEMSVELEASSRHTDLLREGFDVALRAGIVRDQSLIGRVMWRSDMVALASPDYLATHGTPQTAADLAEHDCVRSYAEGKRPTSKWPLRQGGEIEVRGRLASNDMDLHLRAAAEGHGIALAPIELAHPLVEAGRLVQVLEDVIGLQTPVTIVYAERELLAPKVRAFVDVAVDVLAGRPSQFWVRALRGLVAGEPACDSPAKNPPGL